MDNITIPDYRDGPPPKHGRYHGYGAGSKNVVEHVIAGFEADDK